MNESLRTISGRFWDTNYLTHPVHERSQLKGDFSDEEYFETLRLQTEIELMKNLCRKLKRNGSAVAEGHLRLRDVYRFPQNFSIIYNSIYPLEWGRIVFGWGGGYH